MEKRLIRAIVEFFSDGFRREGWRAVGVICAGLLLVEVNVLSARNFTRFDASQGGRYTLSDVTKSALNQLEEPVHVTVLVASTDPLFLEIKQTLTAYRALNNDIIVRYVDPDRDTAEFLALSKRHEIETIGDAEGNLVADAALLLERGDRSWFIRGGQLSELDPDGNIRLRIEARLTEGLVRLKRAEKSTACFVTGHGERSIDDVTAEGMMELRRRLDQGNLVAKRTPLDVPNPTTELADCAVIVVAGPARPWPESHSQTIVEKIESGAHLVLLLDPVVDPGGQIVETGLQPVLRKLGVSATPAFVLERSPEFRLPVGIGESFFAQPRTHPITRGLSTDEVRSDSRVIIEAALPLTKAAGTSGVVFLQTSPRAVTIDQLEATASEESDGTPIALGIAGEVQQKNGPGSRFVVLGSSNPTTNATFREPGKYGTQMMMERVFAWLLESDTLVSVPERPPLRAGLSLSEESLSDLLHYVLLYMPLTAALVGAAVLTRRRRKEDDSRSPKEARGA